VFGVVDSFVEQAGDVVVIQRVGDVAPGALLTTRPMVRSRRSWCEIADCSMPIDSISLLTVQGASRSRDRISRRLGAVRAARVSATAAALAASSRAGGVSRPCTP